MMAVPDRRHAVPVGAMSGVDAVDRVQPGRQDCRIGAVGDEHLDRGEHADGEPGVLESDQSVFSRAGAGERGGPDLTDP